MGHLNSRSNYGQFHPSRVEFRQHLLLLADCLEPARPLPAQDHRTTNVGFAAAVPESRKSSFHPNQPRDASLFGSKRAIFHSKEWWSIPSHYLGSGAIRVTRYIARRAQAEQLVQSHQRFHRDSISNSSELREGLIGLRRSRA
jgi:hypothetical protein